MRWESINKNYAGLATTKLPFFSLGSFLSCSLAAVADAPPLRPMFVRPYIERVLKADVLPLLLALNPFQTHDLFSLRQEFSIGSAGAQCLRLVLHPALLPHLRASIKRQVRVHWQLMRAPSSVFFCRHEKKANDKTLPRRLYSRLTFIRTSPKPK